MNFNPKIFAKKIQSNYIEYDTQIGQVFCHISNRDKNKSDFENFKLAIKDFDFFDFKKLEKEALDVMDLNHAKSAMISSIIKETKYDKHFIDWSQGEKFVNEFLSQFNEVEKVYSNAGFDKVPNSKINVNELNMTGWNKFSNYYWFDYGFIIVSDNKIGVLWFGDES